MKKLLTTLLPLVIVSTSTLRADDSTWTGKGNDRLWTTAANWSDDTLPAPGDSVTISDGGEISCAELPHGFLPRKIQLNLKGKTTLANESETVRFHSNELTVFPGASINAGTIVFFGAQCTIHDGAKIDVKNWDLRNDGEPNADMVFTFILGKTGFSDVKAAVFRAGDFSQQTYIADMAAYAGGEMTIPLLSYKVIVKKELTDDDFKKSTLEVKNPGQFKGSHLRLNTAERCIELVVAK